MSHPEAQEFFLEGIVVFRLVLAEEERRALVQVADQLSFELGYMGDGGLLDEYPDLAGEVRATVGTLSSEDELLVAEMRRALTKIAVAAFEGAAQDAAIGKPVGAALDGAEMVMRGELVMGNAAQLPALMPSFVFLVTLPVVDQDRALELSQRCAKLIDRALDEEEPG